MITVGTLEVVVTNSSFREFKTKATDDKPSRDFSLNVITFYCPSLNILGCLNDWSKSVPADKIKIGDKIRICYDSCHPAKGYDGFFEFRGFPQLLSK